MSIFRPIKLRLTYSMYTILIGVSVFVIGCANEEDKRSASSSQQVMQNQMMQNQVSNTSSMTMIPQKSDDLSNELLNRTAFPATRDLAFIFPIDEQSLLAKDFLEHEWLDQIADTFLDTELREDIRDENWDEDWKLVSIRFSVCSPLGKIADPESIDTMCWPQIRLVWQPIVQNINITELIRPFYSDDRAIHTLYYPSYDHPALVAMQAYVQAGGTWKNVKDETQKKFIQARMNIGLDLLNQLKSLRYTDNSYAKFEMRPEYYLEKMLTITWKEHLADFIKTYCPPQALSELTSFSLPLGRMPAVAELWVFIAFKAANGIIESIDLDVFDPQDASLLYRFDQSENVTSSMGDHRLFEDLDVMSKSQQEQITDQIIVDSNQLSYLEDKIFDPYQTLVPNTSCSSCHRANSLLFNFHNLSYFEDEDLSISLRTVNDVKRDLWNAIKLWEQ
jgi:hypothetical protein